jgi:hypothetical protein
MIEGAMVNRALGAVSFVCCALIIASFGFFAVDQMSGASQQQAAETAGTPIADKAANPDRKQPRKFVDAASKALTAPFNSIVSSNSQWADHLVILVCGLTLYGVGIGYLRRYTAGLPLRA